MLTISFRHFPISAGEKILDLGRGEGRHVINVYLQDNVSAIGVDLSERDLQTAQERSSTFVDHSNTEKLFSLQVADAKQLPFATHTFDKVICSEVLEHIHDYHAVLKEIQRVLKPGGLLAISVPRYWPEKICWQLSRAYHQVEGGHIRIFNARALREEIEAYGMRFTSRHWAHALHTPFWWLKCLLWNKQDDSSLIKLYHRLLVWDLMQKPWLTQTLEKLLNPLMGKSVVMYFQHALHDSQNEINERE